MKIKVNKLEAAESQLVEAIKLFFEERDPVSIHTLASAVLQILHDYLGKDGAIKHNSYFHYHSPHIPDDLRASVQEELKKPANFFKHADKDIKNNNLEIEFDTETSLYSIAEAIRCFRLITGKEEANPEFFAFETWFDVHGPSKNMAASEGIIFELRNRFKNYTKADYLKLISDLHEHDKSNS